MAGLQPDFYSAVAITLTAAVAALLLRLKARRMTKQPLWYDDWFAVVAFIFAVAYCTVVILAVARYGLGQNLDDSDPKQAYLLRQSRFVLWIGSLTYASSIAASKISFLFFYWRLFKFTSIRIPIQVLLVTAAAWFIVRTPMTIFQCLPVKANWDKTVSGAHCPIDQSRFFFSSVLVHCVMDVIILALPLFPIARMRLSRSKKMGVVALFSAGTVVCIASVFVLIESITFKSKSKESTRGSPGNWLWAVVEVNIAVFSGSLPMLRPMVRKLFPSCMGSSDEYDPNYGRSISGVRLSRVGGLGSRLENGQTISSRRMSKPKKPHSRPSWTDLIDDGSPGPSSTRPSHGTADEDHDFNNDDMSDLWPVRQPGISRGDSRRDDDDNVRAGT